MVDLQTKIRFEAYQANLQVKRGKTFTQINAMNELLDLGENQLKAEIDLDQNEQEASTPAE
jgi:hypothetical protein